MSNFDIDETCKKLGLSSIEEYIECIIENKYKYITSIIRCKLITFFEWLFDYIADNIDNFSSDEIADLIVYIYPTYFIEKNYYSRILTSKTKYIKIYNKANKDILIINNVNNGSILFDSISSNLIYYINNIADTDKNIALLFNNRSFTVKEIIKILDKTTFDIRLLFEDVYFNYTDIITTELIDKIVSKYGINNLSKLFFNYFDDEQILEVFKKYDTIMSIDIMVYVVSQIVRKAYFYNYTNEEIINKIIIPFFKECNDPIKLASKLFIKIYWQYEYMYILQYIIYNNVLNINNNNIISFLVKFTYSNDISYLKPDICYLIENYYKEDKEDLINKIDLEVEDEFGVNIANNNISNTNITIILEVFIMYGHIKVTYDFLVKVSKLGIVFEDIERFDLEYGEELLSCFIDNPPIKEYIMKSTIIPDEFKNIWYIVASINNHCPRVKTYSIGNITLNRTTINRADECKYIKNGVIKYMKTKNAHPLFVEMIRKKMPNIYNLFKI